MTSGFEINLENAQFRYLVGVSAKYVKLVLIQNTFNVIDLVYEPDIFGTDGLIKFYLNGVLTALETVDDKSKFDIGNIVNGTWLGCRYVHGQRLNSCDVNFYNIRCYKKALDAPTIVNNYIINYAYYTKDANGNFNQQDIINLKNRNFLTDKITSDGKWECSNSVVTGLDCRQVSLAPGLLIRTNAVVIHAECGLTLSC